MTEYTLYYATNRKHIGINRWRPEGYGNKFSDDGMENLRFGQLTLEADEKKIAKLLAKKLRGNGCGDGEKLAEYLTGCAKTARIDAYEEVLRADISDKAQPDAKLGSQAMFADLKACMEQRGDVLVFIHGFNTSWPDAVGSALALQLALNAAEQADPNRHVRVVLFTWPSDGLALPFVSYKSDRSEAAGSGYAVGRGFLKVRDFLADLHDRAGGAKPCGQNIHLLCHSMGSYLLQFALRRLDAFTPGSALPRLFGHVFLCAADVNDNALEPGQPLARVHEIADNVSIYHNRSDMAMVVSDYTKGNPERLGRAGAARPLLLHHKVHQIDCTPIVKGIVEHSYYLGGRVNADMRQSIDGLAQDDSLRKRVAVNNLTNVWRMVKE